MENDDFLELDALCQRLADGALTGADRDRLAAILASSEEARRHYVRAAALSASLYRYAGEMQAEAPDLVEGKIIRPPAWKWAAGLLAAAAAITLALWLQREPANSAANDTDAGETVARITGSAGARWSGAPLLLGSELRRAQRLELAEGAAEISFDSGAQIILQGPAALELTSAWGAALARGTAHAKVPPEAVGFRVTAPSVEVTDLGTEFSVVADSSNGASEVFVERGSVETLSPGSESAPLVLHERQARRFARLGASSEVHDREAQLAQFARRIAFQRAAKPAGTIAWSFDGPDGEATRAVLTGLPGSAPVTLAMDAPAQVAGRFGQALRLSGKEYGHASIPGLSSRSARTVAFWVRIPAEAELSESGPALSWALAPVEPQSFSLGWNRDPAAGLLGALRARAVRRTVIGATPLRDDRWHHVAAILVPALRNDAAYQLKTYVDGRLEAPSAKFVAKRRAATSFFRKGAPASRAPGGEPDTLYVGGDPSGVHFRGDIDELVIADRALTPREVASLCKGNTLPSTELLAAE